MADQPDATAEAIARAFHDHYERLAPDFGYKTREASAVPWEDVPEANRRLMIATAAAVCAERNEPEAWDSLLVPLASHLTPAVGAALNAYAESRAIAARTPEPELVKWAQGQITKHEVPAGTAYCRCEPCDAARFILACAGEEPADG